jgi:UDP-N-acetylmuramate--alanine ligase
MNSSSDNNHSTERRSDDRYMSCIPVLIQKLHSSQICECTLINISHNGFAVRIEKGKIQFKTEENFLLLMDPNLFDFKNENQFIDNIQLGLPGLHNIENAVAAIEVALHLGISPDKIRKALANFLGVKRRFEYVVKTAAHVYIDDYAHHPEELRACIQAVKSLYPNKKLTAIFQPHLFTRTRDFAEGFAEVLSMIDNLIMLEIYPARELPIEGVNSAMILDNVKCANKQILSKQNAIDYVLHNKPELLLTVGAGDIDTLIQPLKTILQNA